MNKKNRSVADKMVAEPVSRRGALRRIAIACGMVGGVAAGLTSPKAMAGEIDVNGPGGSHVSTYVSNGQHEVTYSSQG